MKLEDLIKQGKFREDLYYRLNIIPINIEPLRNRKPDISPLIYHFLREELGASRDMPEIPKEVLSILENYQWPGNVREIENAIKHCLAFARNNTINIRDLPPRIITAAQTMTEEAQDAGGRFESLKAFLRSKERDYMLQVLERCGGDKEKAAVALKISLATLYRKLAESGAEVPEDQSP